MKIIHSLYFHINPFVDTDLFSSNKNILIMFPQSYQKKFCIEATISFRRLDYYQNNSCQLVHWQDQAKIEFHALNTAHRFPVTDHKDNTFLSLLSIEQPIRLGGLSFAITLVNQYHISMNASTHKRRCIRRIPMGYF